MTEYEKYKLFISGDQSLRKYKEKIDYLVTERGLSSFMNDAKWIELQQGVYKLPFPPPYILKCLTDKTNPDESIFNKKIRWHGDWTNFYDEGMPPLFTIEWIKVSPRYGIYQGQLIEDKIIDETEEFRQLLNSISIPFEEEKSIFTIYGYR